MLDLIKWLWNSTSFRNWTFEGRELANPLLIIWRLFWLIPVKLSLFIFCVIKAIQALDKSEFIDKWKENN
jgi:hypothetical protein